MSKPGKPAWSASGAFPFMPFPVPGTTAPGTPAAGLASGMDLLKNFWGALPGSTQVPGFLVPTVDVEELDKRITDLRAAESWVEVNLNMLRATIQGLEVQRNTIAALKSMSVMPDAGAAAPPSASSPAPEGAALPGIAAGQWLGYLQGQFAKVAEAALATATPPKPTTPKPTPRKTAARKTPRKRPA
jgi:hypothetical protein